MKDGEENKNSQLLYGHILRKKIKRWSLRKYYAELWEERKFSKVQKVRWVSVHHRVDGVLKAFYPVVRWDSPTPSPTGKCPPPRNPGHTRLRERGVRGSQFGRGDRHGGTLGIYPETDISQQGFEPRPTTRQAGILPKSFLDRSLCLLFGTSIDNIIIKKSLAADLSLYLFSSIKLFFQIIRENKKQNLHNFFITLYIVQ